MPGSECSHSDTDTETHSHHYFILLPRDSDHHPGRPWVPCQTDQWDQPHPPHLRSSILGTLWWVNTKSIFCKNSRKKIKHISQLRYFYVNFVLKRFFQLILWQTFMVYSQSNRRIFWWIWLGINVGLLTWHGIIIDCLELLNLNIKWLLTLDTVTVTTILDSRGVWGGFDNLQWWWLLQIFGGW